MFAVAMMAVQAVSAQTNTCANSIKSPEIREIAIKWVEKGKTQIPETEQKLF
jgi:LEA14-like dessication related protein